MKLRHLFKFDGLWRNRDFVLFWQASTVSAFGTSVTRLALPLIATVTLHASPFQIGLIAFAQEAPLLVLGLFAGVWVDQYHRLPIMRVTDLLRFVLLLLIPIAHWQGFLSVPLLIGTALGIGILSVFFEIASQAMTTTLLQPKEFAEGNQKRYAGEAAAMVAGPGLGGALISALGPASSLVVDAGTYLYSFLSLRSMRFIEPEPMAKRKEPMVRSIAQGLREVVRNPYLRAITFASGALTFTYGIGATMLVPFATRELELSSQAIGLAFSMLGVGALLGSLLVGRSVNRLGLGTALVVGLLLDIPGLLLVAFSFGEPWLAATMLTVGLFLVSLTAPIFDVNQFSLRQAVTPDPLRGRMVATCRVIIRGCAALGALAAGIVAELIGLRGAILIAAFAPILPAILVWNSPVRSLKSFPEQPIGGGQSAPG